MRGDVEIRFTPFKYGEESDCLFEEATRREIPEVKMGETLAIFDVVDVDEGNNAVCLIPEVIRWFHQDVEGDHGGADFADDLNEECMEALDPFINPRDYEEVDTCD